MKKEKIIRCLNWFLEYNEETYCGGDRIVEGDKKFYYVSDEDLMAFKAAIELITKPPCEDEVISKIDVIRKINAYIVMSEHAETKKVLRLLKGIFQDTPPVTPVQRSGYWIQTCEADENGNATYRCSECAHPDNQSVSKIVPYCWFCGAKMKVIKQKAESEETTS